jgi:nucleoside-diphosphate-sugar epimerase
MKVLVTGGGGFLGGAIIDQLLARGMDVRSISRGKYPALEAKGVECIQADLSNANAVTAATEGCDAVIHTAAKAGVWGDYDEYFDANVTGTRNVILACKAHAVPKLIYTSTPSVTFAGVDEDGVDESMPYAENFLCNYAATKAQAERDVLAANCGTLSTVALRPHLIWGPGDHHLVPRVIARAKAGKLKLVGSGKNRVDATYIDNAAEAHLCALDVLNPEAACAGRAYYISNDEPIPMGELLNRILNAGGLPPVSRSVPPTVAYFAGATLEKVYSALGKKEEPIMTRFVARQLATAHWFNISGAKRDLGYRPSVNMDEGRRRLANWLKARPHESD